MIRTPFAGLAYGSPFHFGVEKVSFGLTVDVACDLNSGRSPD